MDLLLVVEVVVDVLLDYEMLLGEMVDVLINYYDDWILCFLFSCWLIECNDVFYRLVHRGFWCVFWCWSKFMFIMDFGDSYVGYLDDVFV